MSRAQAVAGVVLCRALGSSAVIAVARSTFVLLSLLVCIEIRAQTRTADSALPTQETVAEAVDATSPEDASSPEKYVLSLSGEPLPLSDLPLATTVITGAELRRWGVHRLPEAFRYVPGVDVFQLNGFTYAVGIRGVGDEFNPRTQVYLDGRLVNVAEFGGVDWESIPVSVDDIDRIEIIRGTGVPGEAGSALDGAIRIWTTKPDEKTPVFTYSGYVGTQSTHSHFGRLAGSTDTFWGKAALEYVEDDGIAGVTPSGFVFLPPRLLDDGQRLIKVNLAGGWRVTDSSELSLRLAGVDGTVEETGGDPISNGRTDTNNYSLNTRYENIFENGARLSLGYTFENFSLKVLDHPSAPDHAAGDNIDLDRHTHSVFGSFSMPLIPELWSVSTTAGWKQDTVSFDRNAPKKDDQEIYHLHIGTNVAPIESLSLSGGIQLERDLFAGNDISPTAGVLYRIRPEHILRLSYRIGRRKPVISETRTAFVVPVLGLPLVTGNRDLDRETVTAYEAGYRGRLEDLGLVVDLQIFHHDIDDKVIFVPDPTSIPGALTFANLGRERVNGVEVGAEMEIHGPLSAFCNYTYQDATDTRADRVLRQRPRHKANMGLKLHFDEGWLQGVSAFANVNYVSRIEQLDALGIRHIIDDRFRLDFRIAKSFLDERLEVALIGRNILDNETLEYRPFLGSNSTGDFGAERAFLFNLSVGF